MFARRPLLALALAIAVSACSRARTERSGSTPVVPAAPVVVATFAGSIDAAGRVTIGPDEDAALFQAAGIEFPPVVQDGAPGTNPDDTVELVAGPGAIGTCDDGLDTIEAPVTLRSFFRKAVFTEAWVEITSLSSPTEHAACWTAASPSPDVSSELGLFAYGWVDRLTEYGVGRPNESSATWNFRLSGRDPFTFRGRVVANVEADLNPPMSAFSLSPATRLPSREDLDVTLHCTDYEEHGCTSYCTTDGSEPSAAGEPCSNPRITETTTIKYFAVDGFGNVEPTHTYTIVIDKTPPTVVATSPAAFAIGVDPAAPVSVTFSEPVQNEPPYLSPSIFLEPEGSTPAPALPLAFTSTDGKTFTALPPTLDAGRRYHLRVTPYSVFDAAGNQMVAEQTFPFDVATQGTWTAPPGSATIHDAALVAAPFGDTALAVWTEETGAGVRLLASVRVNGWWREPRILEAVADAGAIPVRVAPMGAEFAVVWSTPTSTRVTTVSEWGPGPVAEVFAAPSPEGTFDVSADGIVSVVREDGEGGLAVADVSLPYVYPRLPPQVTAARAPVLVRAPSTHALSIYFRSGDEVQVTTSGFPTGLDFGPPETIPGSAAAAPLPPRAGAFPDGTRYVAWGTADGRALVSVAPRGAAFPLAPLDVTASAPSAIRQLVTADDGATHVAAAWRTADRIQSAVVSVNPTTGALAFAPVSVLDDQLALGAPLSLDLAATAGGAFTAVHGTSAGGRTGGPMASRVELAQKTPGAENWQVASFEQLAATAPGAAAEPRVAAAGGGTLITFTVDDGVAHRLATAGSPSGPWVSGERPRASEARGLSLAIAPWGDAIASWLANDRGAPSLNVSSFRDGAWSPPIVVPGVSDPPVAFLIGGRLDVAYLGTGPYEPGVPGVRLFSTGGPSINPGAAPGDVLVGASSAAQGSIAWGPSIVLGPVGTAPEPGVAWADVYGQDGGWSTSTGSNFRTPPQGVTLDTPLGLHIARSPFTVAVAWREREGGRSQIRLMLPRQYTEFVFPEPAVYSEPPAPPAPPAPAVDPSGPRLAVADVDGRVALAWSGGGQVNVRIRDEVTGKWGGRCLSCAMLPEPCTAPQLATDGAGFAAVFACQDGLHASALIDGEWTLPVRVAPSADGYAIAGGPAGYRIAYVARDASGATQLFQVAFARGAAGAPQAVGSPATPLRAQPVLAEQGGFFALGWVQPQGDDPYAPPPPPPPVPLPPFPPEPLDYDPLAGRAHVAWPLAAPPAP
jgi:hypothetical protein